MLCMDGMLFRPAAVAVVEAVMPAAALVVLLSVLSRWRATWRPSRRN